MSLPIRLETLVERHHPEMPRYVTLPSSALEAWKLEGTTTVEGALDGRTFGRRSLKPWGRDRWFVDLPNRWCQKEGVRTGDRVELTLEIAPTELPEELVEVLSASARATTRWNAMTASQQRMLREHVRSAKRPETRTRRARKAFGLA